MNYTLSHSEAVDGWVSFYSYDPDYMIGMNSYFYSFKRGNLYRHNVNSIRNNFYGVQYTSKIRGVFNDLVLENKLFKTLSIEGDDVWKALLTTDIQIDGYIESAWFSKKEQSYFAFIRNSGTIPATSDDYALRSLNGIARCATIVSTVPSAVIVNYSIAPLVDIGNVISVGDSLYYSLPPTYSSPLLFGTVTSIIRDLPNGLNRLIVNTTVTGATIPSIQTPYTLYIKNAVAESHGVLGHYCVYDIENVNTNKVELFAIQSEIMKSYP